MAVITYVFPIKGEVKSRQAGFRGGEDSQSLNNVRPQDVTTGRLRGGQRPGLDKWGNGTQIGSAEQPVVAMCVVASVT